MSINESINWITGYLSQDVIIKSNYEVRIERILKRYGLVAIFILSLIPFPFDIVGIIAGRSGIEYWQFIATVFVGRLIRFFIYVLLLQNFLI